MSAERRRCTRRGAIRSSLIILVDDGSTDGSGELCDSLAEKDSRIIVVHQRNVLDECRKKTLHEARRHQIVVVAEGDELAVRAFESCVLSSSADDPPGPTLIIDDPAQAYQRVFSLAHRRLAAAELRYFSEANWGASCGGTRFAVAGSSSRGRRQGKRLCASADRGRETGSSDRKACPTARSRPSISETSFALMVACSNCRCRRESCLREVSRRRRLLTYRASSSNKRSSSAVLTLRRSRRNVMRPP
jgi:hypothetical protein